MTKISLGDKVKDRISQFTGIVTSRTEFINKCVRCGVSPDSLDKDGKPIDPFVFDEEQLELVTANVYDSGKKRQTGGDRPTPTSQRVA